MSARLVHSGAKLWSMNALAEDFGIDRRTVKKRLEGVSPDGKTSQGHPGWHLSTAAPAICEKVVIMDGENFDPDALPPKDRLDHYKAETEKMKVAQAKGLLLEYEEVVLEFSKTYKEVANIFDTMPDILEREAGLDGKAVEVVERVCDRIRDKFAGQVKDD